MEGYEALYYMHKDRKLIDAVIIHVDDFTLAGTREFIEEVLDAIEKEHTASKVERDSFRYTGIDVEAVEDGIEIKMEDYVDSLEDQKVIQRTDRDENLTKAEMNI